MKVKLMERLLATLTPEETIQINLRAAVIKTEKRKLKRLRLKQERTRRRRPMLGHVSERRRQRQEQLEFEHNQGGTDVSAQLDVRVSPASPRKNKNMFCSVQTTNPVPILLWNLIPSL